MDYYVARYRLVLLFHLIGFITFAGANIACHRALWASAKPGIPPAVRDAWEAVAARLSLLVALPGIAISVGSGLAMMVFTGWMQIRMGPMHAKLAAVAGLLVTSHVEMIVARKLVRARRERGDAAEAEIAARKRRDAALFGLDLALIATAMCGGVLVRS